MSKTLKRAALAVGALTLAAGLASRASAMPVLIVGDHLATSDYVVDLGGTIDGHAFNLANVYESPDVFTIDGGPDDLLAFCVDIYHRFDPAHTPPVTYQARDITHNSHSTLSGNGFALSHLVSGEIGFLAGIGKSTSDAAKLAGIQGAIWKVEYS